MCALRRRHYRAERHAARIAESGRAELIGQHSTGMRIAGGGRHDRNQRSRRIVVADGVHDDVAEPPDKAIAACQLNGERY